MSVRTFSHADAIWAAHPDLRAIAVQADGISIAPSQLPDLLIAALHERARERLAAQPEGEFPEIQAWRRCFSRMGLKPTQYRCAAESLLRRFRKDDALPSLHPLVDACNAASLAFAIPIAVFDLSRVAGSLEVRPAIGSETYLAFGGELEQPDAGEVAFVDSAGHAHARRWCHRQSASSAIGPQTREVLVVAEAMHANAPKDLASLQSEIEGLLDGLGARLMAKGRLERPGARLALVEG